MRPRLKPLDEQVMVITGASSGIGLVTAKQAAERGACVVLTARNEKDLRDATEAIRRTGGRAAHLGGPLSEGMLKDGSVVCPWHGSEFALDDGRVLNGPATHNQPSLVARERDGRVEVKVASPPGDGAAA